MLAGIIPWLVGAVLIASPAWAAEEVYVLWGNP